MNLNELYKVKDLMCRIDPQYCRQTAILNEDKRGKAAKKACYNVIRQFFENDEWLNQEFAHHNNNNHLSAIDYIYEQFMDQFYHENSYQNSAIMRLAPLFLRLALEAGFEQNNVDTTKMNRLHAIENYLHQANKTQGMDLKNIRLDMSYEELNNAFGDVVDNEEYSKKERIENGEYEDDSNYNGYEIVGPLTYEQAHEYGNKSCPGGELCYTQDEGTWNTYTANGMNDVYVLLRDGWESIPAKHDDDGMDGYNGYDRYGLSMIFVFINGDGRLAYCNTRWNHYANYKPGRSVDHALDEEDISKLISKNFYRVFKPNDKWRKIVDEAMQKLRNGNDPWHVFDDVRSHTDSKCLVVVLNGKYNILSPQLNLLCDEWYDWIATLDHCPAVVRLNRRRNYVMENGKLVSRRWFDDGGIFRENHARVKLGDKWNFIDTKGRFICKQWFDQADDFMDGKARVTLMGRRNLVDFDGNLFSNTWFDDIGYSKTEDIYFVCSGTKTNILDENGELLSDMWFDYLGTFRNGYAIIRVGDKWNLCSNKGKIVFNRWFDRIYTVRGNDDILKVVSQYQLNFINYNGDILSDIWFDSVGSFNKDRCYVRKDRKHNFIDTNGNLISSIWFDSVADEEFFNYFIAVKIDDKWNFIDVNGNFVSKIWFDKVIRFHCGRACVKIDDKWNYIDTEGNFISDQWFDECSEFIDGDARVRLNGKSFIINKEGVKIMDLRT